MLVSKIKPCMSHKATLFVEKSCERLIKTVMNYRTNSRAKQSPRDNHGNSMDNTKSQGKLTGCINHSLALKHVLRFPVINSSFAMWMRLGTCVVCLTYLSVTVGSLPTVLSTGNGESGFDSGEGA